MGDVRGLMLPESAGRILARPGRLAATLYAYSPGMVGAGWSILALPGRRLLPHPEGRQVSLFPPLVRHRRNQGLSVAAVMITGGVIGGIIIVAVRLDLVSGFTTAMDRTLAR